MYCFIAFSSEQGSNPYPILHLDNERAKTESTPEDDIFRGCSQSSLGYCSGR
jgi:hypothetical protein